MRLFVLDYGSLELALDVLLPGGGAGEWLTVGVPGYLIRTDDGLNVLVDTGLPATYYDDPLEAVRRDGFGDWLRKVEVSAENRPSAQLAKLGLEPDDVTHQVVTHTHFDHAGGIGDFPGATLVVQRAERERPRPMYDRLPWPDAVASHVIDGDADLCPGIRLLHTPGHTPGHTSVLVSLPQTGPMLLAIDALYLPAVLERDNFKASWSEGKARASGHRVARFAREEGAWLIYGHDPAQWTTLRKAPAFYE